MNSPVAKSRQYYIDWLRVIAIALVFVYHSLRPFGSEYFHVMNDRAYAGVDVVAAILPIFGMPLVFLISGAGAYYALGKRSGGRYLPLQDDLASVVYWYQTLPTTPFPALPDRDYLEVI